MIDQLEHPLMNGAGCIKTVPHLVQMARSSVSAVVLGSITVEPRDGNSGTTFRQLEGYALNALGLPNRGASYYAMTLPGMVAECHEKHKPLIVSIAGFSLSDWELLADMCCEAGVDGVELNFGCPNVQGEHPIWSFDPDGMSAAISSALVAPEKIEGGIRERPFHVGIKLSPFSNPDDLARAVAAIPPMNSIVGQISYVATSNTFPNANSETLSTPYADMSGAALKPIALGQVQQIRELLDPRISVVGVGGIRTLQDIEDYLLAGASAVQATTAYWAAGENPMAFSDILSR